MSHYTLLTTEIKSRIRSAWGATFLISCGRPKIKFDGPPFAVINLDGAVNSRNEGRQKFWKWEFTVTGAFAFDGTSDSESLMMEKARLLILELEPFTEDGTVPTPEGAFAGVGHQHFVTSFGVLEESMEDNFVGCYVKFAVETCVHA